MDKKANLMATGKISRITAADRIQALAASQRAELGPSQTDKAARTKMIRRTASMPRDDAELLQRLVARGWQTGAKLNTSEVMRVGLYLLQETNDEAFQRAAAKISRQKPGRRKD